MLNPHAQSMLNDRYTVGKEKPEEIFKRVADYYGANEGHKRRLLEYMGNNWFTPATPILANGGTDRGLPISCFLNMPSDTRDGIMDHYRESYWMATSGGGVGSYWGDIRSAGQLTSRGTRTSGAIQYMHVADALSLASNQGKVRQGSYIAYLDDTHPELMEFLSMRKASGGDENRRNMNIHHGVNLSDKFMFKALSPNPEERKWDLIDPNSKQITQTLDARDIFQEIILTRLQTGEPIIHWVDRSNQFLHPDLKALGLRVNGSNLCSEITLPTTPDRSAVCCLSSLNLETFDQWDGNKQFIYDCVEFLDRVLTDFIEKAPPFLSRCVESARRERSIGLGTMGFHSYLQLKSLSFEGAAAISTNKYIYSQIKHYAKEQTVILGEQLGPAEDLMNSRDRNAHLLAIAPNVSTSVVAGCSPSIEPWKSNAFTQRGISGSREHRNQLLDSIMERKNISGSSKERMWQDIKQHGGSIAHLTSTFDENERAVFKTFPEIDQRALVRLAADRQTEICQAQSLNLSFSPSSSLPYILDTHVKAFKSGLKTLYYLRTQDAECGNLIDHQVKASDECLACEG